MLPHLVHLLLLLPEVTRATNPAVAAPLLATAKHQNGTCSNFQNSFREANAEMVRCAIDHAKPAQFCTGCVNHFVRFEAAWRQLVTGHDQQTNASCWELFVEHDGLNLVLGVQEKTVELWKAADCQNCFQASGSGRPTNRTTPVAANFYTKLATFDACIRAQPTNSSAIICAICAGDYSDLHTHYTSSVQGGIAEANGVCYDLHDAMKRTRRSWSAEYKCSRHLHESLLAFALSSLVIGLMPAVLYWTAVAMRRRRDARELVQWQAELEQWRRRQITAAVVSQSIVADANVADGSDK